MSEPAIDQPTDAAAEPAAADPVPSGSVAPYLVVAIIALAAGVVAVVVAIVLLKGAL